MLRRWILFLKGIDAVYKRASRRLSYRIQPVCFEDKSHKEIARLLGINEKSSASQLVRAKAALAAKVKEWMKRNA